MNCFSVLNKMLLRHTDISAITAVLELVPVALILQLAKKKNNKIA